ncbi:MAG: hypothetical protein ACREGL_10665 [Alphaproteobacteria bacterium]
MNETSAKAANSEDEAAGVHRLRDIVVEEVSLVDRAANQRRFLVVKRSPEMADDKTAGADTKPDKPSAIAKAKKKPPADAQVDPTVDEAAKAADDETADEADTQKVDAPKDDASDNPDEAAGGKKKQRKADDGLVIAAPVKEALLGVLTQALERLMALASSIKDAIEPDDGTDATMPDDVGNELAAIAEMLSVVDKRKTAKAEVVKAGARMSKDRLDRFQKAMAALAAILKELTDAKETPEGPSAGAAESGVKKRSAVSPAAPAVPGLEDLVSGIGDLTRVVKRQEEELTRMRQARGVSNAIPVEGGRRAEHQDVSWPLDMNRPISRDKVRKEVSFFDE